AKTIYQKANVPGRTAFCLPRGPASPEWGTYRRLIRVVSGAYHVCGVVAGARTREAPMDIRSCWTRTAIAAIWLLPTATAARPFDACRATARTMYGSCSAGVQSDRALAFGKCNNVGDPGTVKTCRAQAAADAKDGRAGCADER